MNWLTLTHAPSLSRPVSSATWPLRPSCPSPMYSCTSRSTASREANLVLRRARLLPLLHRGLVEHIAGVLADTIASHLRLDRDSAAIRSPVQDSRRPTRCAGGPGCTQGQGLAPRQQCRRPGLSIAGRSVVERARPTRGQHATHRNATTPRFPRWSRRETPRELRFEPSRKCAHADCTCRDARRSGSRMPMIASPARSAIAVANQTPERAASGWLRKMRAAASVRPRSVPAKVGCLCVRKSSRKEEVTRTQKPFIATLRVNESRPAELGQ